ncbi:MAG TPA: hypothetical protein VL294_10885 [Pseudolysinimonas sp.]|jgi:adenylate kinase family enzyme|nr:hypothetical protein [Pseudolysinimonas sp.]
MRIITWGAPGLGVALAEQLSLPHIRRVEEVRTDDFVLDGAPRDLGEARALDAMLRGRAAEVDAVLVHGEAPEAVLEHYFGRVIELPAEDALAAALDALREVLLAA